MVDSIGTVIARLEAAILEGIKNPPQGEFGYTIVHVADLRRLITEVEKHKHG